MATRDELERLLTNLDGKGYPAYRDLRGRYTFPGFDLVIDHVQPDPFAPPSRMRVFVPASVAAFPANLYRTRSREVALRDYLVRRFVEACQQLVRQRPAIAMDRPGQEILERTAILVNQGQIEARFMENYLPCDMTAEARRIAQKYAAERRPEGGDCFGPLKPRTPDPASIDPSRGRREVSLKARGLRALAFGRSEIDLAAVEQLVDDGQVRALGHALNYARDRCMDHQETLAQILDRVMADLGASGLDILTPWPVGDLAHFRRFELAAALNRLRGLRVS